MADYLYDYSVMQRLLLCLLACATAAAQELRCTSPDCTKERTAWGWDTFAVNGSTLTIFSGARFILRCTEYSALELYALPRFTSEYRISEVQIHDCLLPNNCSIGAVLVAMNIVLQPQDGYTNIQLLGINTKQFEAHHFSRLEKLTNLTILQMTRPTKVGHKAFTELINLRSLYLRKFELEVKELYHLPSTLLSLHLFGVTMKPLEGSLPIVIEKILREIPQLRMLSLDYFNTVTSDSMNMNERELQESKKSETFLEVVTLESWQERQLPAIKRCGRLRKFELTSSNVEEISDVFMSACPNLEEFEIYLAEGLKTLPSTFLKGATALKNLYIRRTKIETLPAGFFQDTRNLVRLDLTDNLLKELPSGVFVGVPLEFLSLSRNPLSEDALNEVATVTSLTELRLAKNSYPNICEGSGYSLLQNLTKLKILDLSKSGVGRICRDWREHMMYLEHLDLYDANITDLNYNDLQYIRDPSVENAKVLLKASAPIIFSENDYKKALTAPATAALVTFEDRELALDIALAEYYAAYHSSPSYRPQFPACDCTTYWFRKAMDDASRAVRTEGYTCRGGKLLKDMKTDEFCPESERV